MGTILTRASVSIDLRWLFENVLDQGNAKYDRQSLFVDSLVDGDAVDSAQVVFYDEVALGASGTQNYDLYGGLTDAFGNTINFTKLKGLFIHNTSSTAGDILKLDNSDTDGLDLITSTTADDNANILIGPGGVFFWWNPSLAGHAVTDATSDSFDIIEQGGSNTVTYRIAIIGTDGLP